jgi:Spy/CpxP family protein refolding chaperone
MTTPIRTGRRARLAAAAVLVATFVLGGVAGAVLDRALPWGDEQDRVAGLCGAGLGPGGQPLVLQQLDLTPEQRPRLEGIVARRHPQMQALWQEFQPRVNALMDSARTEMDAILTPEQQAKHDSLRAACGGGLQGPGLGRMREGEAGR